MKSKTVLPVVVAGVAAAVLATVLVPAPVSGRAGSEDATFDVNVDTRARSGREQ